MAQPQSSLGCKTAILEELKMSGINGDKARFHRERKQKIRRRERQRKMFGSLPPKPAKPTTPGSGAESKEKLA